MKATRLATMVAVAAMAALAATAVPAQVSKVGQREYQNSCAVCHGASGKGDGAYAGLLDTRIPDLTLMQKNNGGVFPVARVYEIIDGNAVIKAHGTREMPIWGNRYRVDAAGYYVDVPYNEGAFVQARMLALIEYLSTLQAK